MWVFVRRSKERWWGSFEELLVKARFEEAKLRDLAGSGGEKSKKVSGGPVEAGTSRSGSGIAERELSCQVVLTSLIQVGWAGSLDVSLALLLRNAEGMP